MAAMNNAQAARHAGKGVARWFIKACRHMIVAIFNLRLRTMLTNFVKDLVALINHEMTDIAQVQMLVDCQLQNNIAISDRCLLQNRDFERLVCDPAAHVDTLNYWGAGHSPAWRSTVNKFLNLTDKDKESRRTYVSVNPIKLRTCLFSWILNQKGSCLWKNLQETQSGWRSRHSFAVFTNIRWSV